MEKNKAIPRRCSAVIGTLTLAQKAQRALSAAAIPVSIDKSQATAGHHGCVWSIHFSCNQYENVRAVLASSNIKVKLWENSDDIL